MGTAGDFRDLSNSLEFKLGQSDSTVYFQYRNDGTSEVRKEASKKTFALLHSIPNIRRLSPIRF